MIVARADFAPTGRAMLDAARRLAAARLRDLAAAGLDPDRRWRRAGLLWPLFTKD